jgi:hypothetical protein
MEEVAWRTEIISYAYVAQTTWGDTLDACQGRHATRRMTSGFPGTSCHCPAVSCEAQLNWSQLAPSVSAAGTVLMWDLHRQPMLFLISTLWWCHLNKWMIGLTLVRQKQISFSSKNTIVKPIYCIYLSVLVVRGVRWFANWIQNSTTDMVSIV